MANIPVSYQNASVRGVAAFEVMDTFIDANLVAGAEPAIGRSIRLLLADSQTLAAFTVVGLDANKKLVKAVYNATVSSGVIPVGVLVHAATSSTSNTTVFGEVWMAGNFNVGSDDAGTDSPLVWDTSFDTIAKKTTWAGLPVYQGNPDLLFRRRLVAG